MSQREFQIVTPAPHLSPAFKIVRGHYDRRGIARQLVKANLNRLSRLEECHQAIALMLADIAIRKELTISALRSTTLDFGDALLHEAFTRATQQIFALNTARVYSALSLDTSTIPPEADRLRAVRLYGADHNATWPQIAEEREAYHATDWLLGYAAETPGGRMPLSIRQSLVQVAEGLVPAPQPELAETYRQWGALVLANMPHPDECID